MSHEPGHIDFTSLGSYNFNNATPLSNFNFTQQNQGQANLADQLASYRPQVQVDTPPTGKQGQGFDIWGQGGANIAGGLQGLGSLANAYAAYKQYQLGKDTLAQNRALANRNLANQAQVTNAQIEDRARRRALERSDLAGNFAAIEAAAENEAAKRRISGEPI